MKIVFSLSLMLVFSSCSHPIPKPPKPFFEVALPPAMLQKQPEKLSEAICLPRKSPIQMKKFIERQEISDIVVMTIFFESRGEPIEGQVAIYDLIRNRSIERSLSMDAICLQRYQFSCWNNRSPERVVWGERLRAFKEQLEHAIAEVQREVAVFNYYHNPSLCSPKHYERGVLLASAQIGSHLFYRIDG